MGSDAEIIKRHVEALLEETRSANIPADVVGRMLFQEAIEIWKRERSLADIESELKFVAENLDPDSDFVFMRP